MFEALKEAIRQTDKELTDSLLAEAEQKIIEGDKDTITAITTPQEITELHSLLIENFKISPRAMMVKGRVTTRTRRALLFCKAMRNGVSRVQ